MSYAAAVARLKVLTFTGLVTSYDIPKNPPVSASLPATIINNASQPFVDKLELWNQAETKSNFTVFVDHILLIETHNNGTEESRYDNLITYLDRYLVAINGDMDLNGNLAVPLQIIVAQRGKMSVRKQNYSGIQFRHKWILRIG